MYTRSAGLGKSLDLAAPVFYDGVMNKDAPLLTACVGDQPLCVALYQYAAHGESPERRLGRLDGAAKRAAAAGAHLVICPELFLSGYNVGLDHVRAVAEPANGPAAGRIAEIARRHGVALAVGYPEAYKNRCYNACMVLGSDGVLLANFRKLHLPNDFERALFETGDGLALFELNGWRIGVLICFDNEYPEAMRRYALEGAALVFGPTALRAMWAQVSRCMIPTRALENRFFVAYANYGGVEGDFDYLGESRIVGPDGVDRAVGGQDEDLVVAHLYPHEIADARTVLDYMPTLRDLSQLKAFQR